MGNALHAEIAAAVVAALRDRGALPGSRVSDQAFARALNVSRTPVRAAFEQLAGEGVLTRVPPRGWRLVSLPETHAGPARAAEANGEEPLHSRMLRDRALGRLGSEVFERELVGRYCVLPSTVKRALTHLSADGLIERRPGHGWHFSEAISSLPALLESYAFRELIECGALAQPDYHDDPEERQALIDLHREMMETAPAALDPNLWFETNRRFHEFIVAGAGNRFMSRALSQLNQLRRLWEYAEFPTLQAARIRQSCVEHLAILAALEDGDRAWAAALLRRHLKGAAQSEMMPEG